MASKTDLRVILGVDGERQFSQTMKNLAAQQKAIRAETRNATAALSEQATANEHLRVKADGLNKQISVQAQKVDALKAAYEASVQKKGQDADATLGLKAQYENANAALLKMQTELQKTTTELNKQTDASQRAAQKVGDFAERADKAGEKLNTAGKKMKRYITTPVLAAGVAASKAAIDFEDAFMGIQKTVDGTPEEFQQLEADILDMSTTLATSATEIAGVAEAAGQLGIKTKDISGFTETMVKLGMATDLSAQEAATASAKIAAITKMQAQDYDRLGNTLVGLGNRYNATESEILAMTTRLAATGEVVGYTAPQLLAIATALTSVGIEAEAGGSAFSKLAKDVELSVQQGGKRLQMFASVAGVSAKEFKAAYEKDALGAVNAFIKGLNDTERNGKNAVQILEEMGLTEVRLSNTILALASSEDVLGEAVAQANKSWKSGSELQDEVNKRLETAASKLRNAKGELTKAAIILGGNFLPAVARVAEKVGSLAEKFAELDEEQQDAVVTVGLLLGLAGPVTKAAGGVSSALSSGATIVQKLISSGGSLAGLMGTGGPLVLAFGAAAGAGALLYAAYQKLHEGEKALETSLEGLQSRMGQWEQRMGSARNLLADLNQEIFVSSEEAQRVNAAMESVQSDITEIARRAAEERRALTAGEIQRLDELFAQMEQLSQRQLEMQKAYQDAAYDMARMTDDFSAQNVANLKKTAEDTRTAVLQEAKKAYMERLALLNTAYQQENGLTDEQMRQEREKAKAHYDQAVQDANDKHGQILAALNEGYFQQNVANDAHFAAVANLKTRLEELATAHSDNMRDIQTNQNLTRNQQIQLERAEDNRYKKEKQQLYEELAGHIEGLDAETLEAWVSISAETEAYQGEISDANKKFAEDFVGAYDDMPEDCKKSFKNVMQGMLDGIKERTGELYAAATKVAGGFLAKIKEKLGIASPSKEMKKLFRYAIEGAEVGTQEERPQLLREAETTAAQYLSEFDAVPQDLETRLSGTAARFRALQGQIQAANATRAAIAGQAAVHPAQGAQRVSRTVSNDYSNHFDAVFKAETLVVRNDNDIRKLSSQIEAATRTIMNGKGAKF